jgi:hypothetical protein
MRGRLEKSVKTKEAHFSYSLRTIWSPSWHPRLRMGLFVNFLQA